MRIDVVVFSEMEVVVREDEKAEKGKRKLLKVLVLFPSLVNRVHQR